jgi:hypothetical protein
MTAVCGAQLPLMAKCWLQGCVAAGDIAVGVPNRWATSVLVAAAQHTLDPEPTPGNHADTCMPLLLLPVVSECSNANTTTGPNDTQQYHHHHQHPPTWYTK